MFGCGGGGSNIITGPKTLCDEIGIPEGKLKSEVNIEFCKINDRSLIVYSCHKHSTNTKEE